MATKPITAFLVPETHEVYSLLDSVIESWHPQLHGIAQVLCFWKSWSPDKDGITVWGKAVLPNDVQKELREHDLQIHLNQDVWDKLDQSEKSYLLDHECTHFSRVEDSETGELKEDDNGRPVFRIRKHDFEDFRSVVKRHPDAATAG